MPRHVNNIWAAYFEGFNARIRGTRKDFNPYLLGPDMGDETDAPFIAMRKLWQQGWEDCNDQMTNSEIVVQNPFDNP